MTVRSAVRGDRDAVLALVLAAFSSADHDGSEEANIVLTTWALEATAVDLELVAVHEAAIVGYVLAAWGDLGGHDAVAVAPLAVSPFFQGSGIGTALIDELLHRAESQQLPLIVLLGSPMYYGRFGFEPSGPLGISYRPAGQDNPHFQVRRLSTAASSYRGEFTYCWEAPGS